MTHSWNTTKVLRAVSDERARQDRRFGEQNHPDFVDLPNNPEYDQRRWAERADAFKNENAVRVDRGKLAWDGILLEEVYEALAEDDPDRLEAELIQVAAVAVAWIEAINRRRKA